MTKVLANPSLEAGTRERLLFAGAVLGFAHEELGLAGSTNYTCYYDTDGQPVSWNVSASPPHRFAPYQWWFPIVGRVPYKGYFDEHAAMLAALCGVAVKITSLVAFAAETA